jgi:hypothetical protein
MTIQSAHRLYTRLCQLKDGLETLSQRERELLKLVARDTPTKPLPIGWN